MRNLLVVCLFLAASLAAAAGRSKKDDDAPIPYDTEESDDDKRRDLPKRSEEAPTLREETEVEQQDREISLASYDDPNIGLSGEVLLGAMLLESTRGAGGGVEPIGMGGLRFTWEWSRTLLSDEFWREVFFADVTWAMSQTGGGSNEIKDAIAFHYFTLAQAFAFPLGKTPFAAYAEAGIGFNYQTSALSVQGADPVTVSVARLLAQYGFGIRARVGLNPSNSVRLSFRIEVTRFRRGYMDDTLIGGSLGVTF